MELIHSFPEFQSKLVDGSLIFSVLNPSGAWRVNTLPLRVFELLKFYSGNRVVIDLQTIQAVDDVALDVVRTIHQLSLHDSREVVCLIESEKITDALIEYSESHSLPITEPTLAQSKGNRVDLNAKGLFQLT